MKNLILSITLLFFFFNGFTQIVDEDYKAVIEPAREEIRAWMENKEIPGTQVAVLYKGKLVWSEGFGYSDLELMVPVTSETKMRIGSVSKTYTAAALGKLMQEGKLDLDLPVQKYVPYFPEKRYTITTRQVAGHLGGIRHYRDNEFMMNRYFATIKEGIGIFMDDTLLYSPNEKYSYSSYGYNLLSGIIEGASDTDFLKYMQKNVFDEIQMPNTTADINWKIIPNRSSFYSKNDSIVINAIQVDNSYKWAGGGFISTCEDMVHFGEAFLDNSYLSRDVIDELWKPQQTADGKSTNYGIGWASGENENFGKWYGHAGGSVGGTTQFFLVPDHNFVIAMVVNLGGVNYEGIHQDIALSFIQAKDN